MRDRVRETFAFDRRTSTQSFIALIAIPFAFFYIAVNDAVRRLAHRPAASD